MTEHVLVTGGAGYVGSHCCKALAGQDLVPVVFDNLSTGHREFVKWGPLVEGDIRDRQALVAAMKRYRPVAVMHFAALALVGESMRLPERYRDVNIGGSLSLLGAMRDAGVNRLVFSSTCAVYGEPGTVPISEDAPKHPINPYGASKLEAERLMDAFDASAGIKSVRLRYFNAAGADPDGDVGEDHDPETHLIPIVLDVALGRRSEVSVFGTDYPTPDGTAVRDYIHVADLASAHVKALRHLLAGGATLAVNLGTGVGASVAEIVATVEQVAGRTIRRADRPRREGDPATLVADARRARQLLDWSPRFPLVATVADAWRWHQACFGARVSAQAAPAEAQPA